MASENQSFIHLSSIALNNSMNDSKYYKKRELSVKSKEVTLKYMEGNGSLIINIVSISRRYMNYLLAFN